MRNFRGIRQGKDGTAAAAHERIEHLGLLLEPSLDRGQPRIFSEGGRLKVVAEAEVGKGTAQRTLTRILRVGFVGPGGRNAEARMHEQTLQVFLEQHGLDNFPSPATDRRRAINEKRNVAAEPCRQFGQLGIRAFC
jgi:hypothetical protein